MFRSSFSVVLTALLAIGIAPALASADLLIAADDASQSAYNDGWQVNDNGGSGFGAWTTIGRENGTGSGGGFIANNNSQSQINVSSKAFGLFGNGGGVGHAIRTLSNTIGVNHRFSLKMDNGFIDSGGPAVGFGLQNSSGQNLFEFFFAGGDPSYKVNRSGGSVATGVGFTNQGLELAFTLTGSNSFLFKIHRLVDSVNTNTFITGNLITQSGGQTISRLRLFNANAGFNADHDAFFNSFNITAIPEGTAAGFFCVAMGLSGVAASRRRKRPASHA